MNRVSDCGEPTSTTSDKYEHSTYATITACHIQSRSILQLHGNVPVILTQKAQNSIPDSTSRARVRPTCVRPEQPFMSAIINA